jgi:hypothetical protein
MCEARYRGLEDYTDRTVILLGILGASAWGLVVFYATNAGTSIARSGFTGH